MSEESDHNDHGPMECLDDESDSSGDGRSFFSTWGWPLFGLAAFAIFELTASLMWSSLVFALRFGWKDAYAGWFFWRRDTKPSRGLASGLLYLTSATSKVFIAGFALMLGLIMILGPPGQQQVRQVDVAMFAVSMLFLAGMLASGLFGFMSATICRWSRRRLWVDGDSYQQALNSDWPPRYFTANRSPTICFFAMIPLTGLFLILTLCLPLVWFVDPMNRNPPLWPASFLLVSPMASFLFFCYGIHWLRRTVTSVTPWDCWPELLDLSAVEIVEILNPIQGLDNGIETHRVIGRNELRENRE